MKVIMVPVADRPECRVALEAAFGLARELSANLVGYHLRPHREEHPVGDGSRLVVTFEEMELPEASPSVTRLNSQQAQQLFRAIAEQHGFPVAKKPRVATEPLAFWNETVGTPEKLFGIIGPTSDCIVVSHPKARGSGSARAFLLAALLRSGRPVLVLPQHRSRHIGRKVLIAWDQGLQAALAVSAALPLLARAEAVHIMCCGKESLPGPKVKHGRNYLLHWGIESRAHRGKGRDVPGELLKTYKDNDCDLLLMGAYSRSHLRQRILGGVTHDLLLKADVPVLALHA